MTELLIVLSQKFSRGQGRFTDNVQLTPGDRRAYISYAKTERHKSFENIDVTFGDPRNPGPRNQDPASQND